MAAEIERRDNIQMASQEGKSNINIGSSSMILIFIVLCLSTFGLLSLTSAERDWNLAQKSAAAVQGYYEADVKGEEFVRMVDETLEGILADGPDGAEFQDRVRKELSDYYQEDTGFLAAKIPMEYDQALYIELAVGSGQEVGSGEQNRIQTHIWKVVNTVDYEIDDSMPVWGGQ